MGGGFRFSLSQREGVDGRGMLFSFSNRSTAGLGSAFHFLLQCWEGEAGRLAPIELENAREMDHFMALKTTEKIR